MAYKEWPVDLVPNSNSIMLTQPTFQYTSNFTGVTQTSYHPGAKWTVSMSFIDMPDWKRRMLSAFVNGMQGRLEAVKIYDHTRKSNPAMGAPYVSGDSQKGRNLLTMGWLPNMRVLRMGDQFTVNNELKEVSEDIWSDGNGTATIYFNPPLRKPPPNSATLETEKPYMLATLTADGAKFSNTPGVFTSVDELEFEEAIYK